MFKPLLSVGEYTTKGGVTVLYGDKGYMFHKGSNVAKKMDAWVQKELRDSQYRGCTVAYKENNVYNIYVKPRENKIDAMPLSGDSETGGLPAGSEPVRPENPGAPGGAQNSEVPGGARDPEVPGGARDPMRDDVDGDEAMVPRVPNLPPELSSRQIAEHELTGHAVYRSWCRHCVASKGRAQAHSSREEGELPEIGIDYGFFGRDKEDVLPWRLETVEDGPAMKGASCHPAFHGWGSTWQLKTPVAKATNLGPIPKVDHSGWAGVGIIRSTIHHES